MDAFENEKLLLESDNNQLKLTSHRLRYYKASKRNSDFTSIMIDKISAIELTYYKSSIWILILGIITIPIILGIILLYIYFTTKRHVVVITSDGGKPIVFETFGMKRKYLEHFIQKTEEASMKLRGL